MKYLALFACLTFGCTSPSSPDASVDAPTVTVDSTVDVQNVLMDSAVDSSVDSAVMDVQPQPQDVGTLDAPADARDALSPDTQN